MTDPLGAPPGAPMRCPLCRRGIGFWRVVALPKPGRTLRCGHCRARLTRQRPTRAVALADLALSVAAILGAIRIYDALSGWRVPLTLALLAAVTAWLESRVVEFAPVCGSGGR